MCGSRAAPATRLDVQLHPLVGEFQQPLCGLEQAPAEVRDEPERIDVGAERIDDVSQLIGLCGGVELRLVADEVVDPPMRLRKPGRERQEVEFGADLDGLDRHAESTRHPCPVTIELRQQQAALVASAQVVVDLQCEGRLPGAHRAETETQDTRHHMLLRSVRGVGGVAMGPVCQPDDRELERPAEFWRHAAVGHHGSVTNPPEPVVADLMAMLRGAPSPYHAVAEAARRLVEGGFDELQESASWAEHRTGQWFVRRGGALVAWRNPDGVDAEAPLRLIGAHTDSPNLRIKPRPDGGSAGWRQLAIEVYGGILNNTWLDRDLGLSGRVVLRDGTARLLLIDRPLLRVPQLAVHLDRDVNEKGLILDRQSHLTPIWGLGELDEGAFVAFVAEELKIGPGDIVSWDLMVHDVAPPALIGRDNELLAGGRLDNLTSCHAAVTALVASTDAPGVVALFDHEEVGSSTTSGAAGPLLETVLRRRASALLDDRTGVDEALARSFSGSVCLSADMAHAVHPNYTDRHEPAHHPIPNKGPVLKENANQRYASDAVSAAVFIRACDAAGVPYQVFVSRNNLACGSTIGPITATRLGISTVDVGSAQLSMHSARELMGAADQPMMVAAMTSFLAGTP